MIIFWILAAGLTGLTLLVIVAPLLKRGARVEDLSQNDLNLGLFRDRLAELDGDLAAGTLDQARYEAARRDLERELLHDLHPDAPDVGVQSAPRSAPDRAPLLALVLALAIPAAAVLGYLQLGDPGIIARLEAGAAPPSEGQAAASLEVLAQGLAERLEKAPDNLDGWLMLGRTWFALGQPKKALAALERAYGLAPEQADVQVAYAEALAVEAGNDLNGRPAELIQAALAKEPGHQGARWLAGTLAYQQGRFADAAETWQGLLASLEPNTEETRQLDAMIAAARAKAGGAAVPAQPPAAGGAVAPSPAEGTPAGPDAAPSAVPAAVEVQVSLAPELAGRTGPEDTVFVFARTPAGPPMPLAAKRLRVADLPATLTLDDAAALIPNLRLSNATEVLIGARISRTGQATPATGDLEGESGPVPVSGAGPVAVKIDRVRP